MSTPLFNAPKTKEYCPKCGSELQIRQGKFGRFLGCMKYPECDFLKPLQTNSGIKIIKTLPKNCPECAELLQLKQGSFGMFIGCSNYPICHYVVPHNEEQKAICPCPNCSGELVERLGKNGKVFWGCINFPQCKTTASLKPRKNRCDFCGFDWQILKKKNKAEKIYQCLKCQQINKKIIEENE